MKRRMFLWALLAPVLPALRVPYRQWLANGHYIVLDESHVFHGMDMSFDGDRTIICRVTKDGQVREWTHVMQSEWPRTVSR